MGKILPTIASLYLSLYLDPSVIYFVEGKMSYKLNLLKKQVVLLINTIPFGV